MIKILKVYPYRSTRLFLDIPDAHWIDYDLINLPREALRAIESAIPHNQRDNHIVVYCEIDHDKFYVWFHDLTGMIVPEKYAKLETKGY